MADIVQRYLEERARLMTEGVPTDHWRVRIHPQDAAGIAHLPVPLTAIRIAKLGDALNAEWFVDETVPIGEVRIDVPWGGGRFQ